MPKIDINSLDPAERAAMEAQAGAAGTTLEALAKSETAATEQVDDAAKQRANAETDAVKKAKKKGQAEENPEDDDEAKEPYEKALVQEEDLVKSLDILEQVASGTASPDSDRRAELAQKLTENTLEKGERAELMDLLKAEEPDTGDEDLSKSFTEIVSDDPQIQEGYDAMEFLERFATLQTGALDQVKEVMEKGFGKQGDFNKAMAHANALMGKVVIGQGALIKSLTERLGIVEKTPMPRRGVSSAQQLQKSTLPTGDKEQLQYAQVEQGFNAVTQQSIQEGRGGMAKCGEDPAEAWAIYSRSGHLSPAMHNEIKSFLG